jgi:hypothetical protein
LQSLRKHSDRVDGLEKVVSAQSSLISSQAEMLKEMNKKLLENEQKLDDFFKAKNCLKRQSSPSNSDLPKDKDEPGPAVAKRMKT